MSKQNNLNLQSSLHEQIVLPAPEFHLNNWLEQSLPVNLFNSSVTLEDYLVPFDFESKCMESSSSTIDNNEYYIYKLDTLIDLDSLPVRAGVVLGNLSYFSPKKVEPFYRGDKAHYKNAFKHGFEAPGTNTGKNSAYISTSFFKDEAVEFPKIDKDLMATLGKDPKLYVYEIRSIKPIIHPGDALVPVPNLDKPEPKSKNTLILNQSQDEGIESWKNLYSYTIRKSLVSLAVSTGSSFREH